ncbi:MAG: GAF domain-containing protein, partial [Deltaproteobacteria bacterium]|nr:GAF domain-containing protein [Deltaproteobacteria bacterium]
TGYSNSQLSTMRMVDLLPDSRLSDRAWVQSGSLSKGPVETEAVRRDRTKIPVEVNLAPLKMGSQTLLLSIIHDIGDRKRAENLTLAQRDLSTRLSAVSSLSEALQLCMDTTLQLSGMDAAGVFLPDKEGRLNLAAWRGLSAECVEQMSHLSPDAALVHSIRNAEPLYSTCDELGLPVVGVDGQGSFRAVAVIPVLYEGQVIASLAIASRSIDDVPVATRNTLEAIIAQIGSAIARVRAEEALLEAHQELEERVQVRTRELVEANVRLEQEISQRKAAEQHIRKSLKEKEALLQEVHHRVKNNLQIISSLLALQRNQVRDEKTLDVLRDSQSRIRSMAFIHEHLYRSPELSRVNFADYIKDLVGALLQSYSDVSARIKLTLDLQPVFLGVSTALPCGLVLNEVVSNCLKHAFPDARLGVIAIQLRRRAEREYELTISDDGVGLPRDLDYRDSQTLGLRLVTNLTELQLRGSLEIRSETGTSVCVRFEDRETSETRRKH